MLNASVEKKNMKSIFFHTNRNIQQWQREITEHLLWQKEGYYCLQEWVDYDYCCWKTSCQGVLVRRALHFGFSEKDFRSNGSLWDTHPAHGREKNGFLSLISNGLIFNVMSPKLGKKYPKFPHKHFFACLSLALVALRAGPM